MKKELLLATVAAFSLSACTTTGWNSNAVKGGAGGAAAGAVAGLVYASVANKDARTAALVGAGLGALTGASVGAYMDRQEAELRNSLANTGVTVTRQGDQIILNMPSNVTFRTDQSNVEPQFYETLNSVAAVLQKYPKTPIRLRLFPHIVLLILQDRQRLLN